MARKGWLEMRCPIRGGWSFGSRCFVLRMRISWDERQWFLRGQL